MTNKLLDNNPDRPIERIGDTVHRPTHHWTPAVHDLLNYLQSVNFPYSPKVLGFDENGREILSYIDGQSGGDGWAKIVSDDGLRKFAKLLRAYHDVITDYKPPVNAEWACAIGVPKNGEIMCHGDFGPWNIVWDDDNEPVGIVDWDLVVPAKPRFDVLYALEYSAPFRDDEAALKWHHFPKVPNRQHRIEVFAEAYGLTELGDVVTDVATMQRQVAGFEKQLAERGLQPQAEWVANGDLEVIEQHAKWTESHRSLFE
ncbi:MAG TPA: aminoglycoside phosphotransferase family protein [Candidatus Saccharimonadia bacterium]|nr:aminoglycoside phosphotransferase family protein [Candidatus Saccharimonadia bacterium]